MFLFFARDADIELEKRNYNGSNPRDKETMRRRCVGVSTPSRASVISRVDV